MIYFSNRPIGASKMNVIKFYLLAIILAVTVIVMWWMADSHEYDRTVNEDDGVIYKSKVTR